MYTRRLFAMAAVLALAACGRGETPHAAPTPAPAPDAGTGFPTEPPAPLPVQDVDFPDYAERTLENGARLVVVENHEQPVVTIQLLMPGGSAADPAELTGLASLTASQIDKGTESRSALEIAEAMDFIGARMGAGASSEWTSVFLTTLTDFLDPALEIMADVVLHPTFPADELQTERQRRLSSLRLEKSQPAALARDAFMEHLYGEHPYGRSQTEASLAAIDVDALEAYHAQHYVPGDALFVVAGDVDPDRIARDLELAFAGWDGQAPSEAARPEPPTRSGRSMVFVHKPGSVQAVIRLGHLFPSATAADWPTLDLANQVLGDGSAGFSAWMNTILREEKGFTYGAYSSMAERQGPGYFTMSGEFRNEVADSALAIMLELADRLRTGDIPEEDIEEARRFITGSFPLSIETPQEVASQVASNRLLGRPDSYLEEYRGRVAAVSPSDVARVAGELIDPDRMLVVVVGDATQILADVREFAGEVEVVDVDGEPVDVGALAAAAEAAASRSFDVSGIEPRELTYGVLVQGNQVAEIVTRWTREGDVFAVVTEQGSPAGTVTQTTEFDARTFSPIRSAVTAGSMGEFGVEVEGGRVMGQVLDPRSGPREVDLALPEGAALQGQFDLAVAVTDFDDVGELTLQVLTGAGTVAPTTATVSGEETVEVPAGSFETWRLELSGEQPMTVWVTRSDPHIVVKRELAGQPVSVVLTSM